MPSRTLRRRLASLTEIARDRVRRREILRDTVKAADTIRAALAEARIDPARIAALRGVAAAEEELARLGDSPELRRADLAFVAQDPLLAGRESLTVSCTRQAPRFAGRRPPGRGAALRDWYAWSLAVRQP